MLILDQCSCEMTLLHYKQRENKSYGRGSKTLLAYVSNRQLLAPLHYLSLVLASGVRRWTCKGHTHHHWAPRRIQPSLMCWGCYTFWKFLQERECSTLFHWLWKLYHYLAAIMGLLKFIGKLSWLTKFCSNFKFNFFLGLKLNKIKESSSLLKWIWKIHLHLNSHGELFKVCFFSCLSFATQKMSKYEIPSQHSPKLHLIWNPVVR